jgi:hypothetical protein
VPDTARPVSIKAAAVKVVVSETENWKRIGISIMGFKPT